MQTRRQFLQSTAAAAGAGLLMPRLTSAFGPRTDLTIGFQTWVVREALEEDITGSLSSLADAGYESLELCSPAGYGKYGFGHMAQYGTDGLKGIIGDAGLNCTSSHFTIAELREDLMSSIGFAQAMGLTQMVLATRTRREPRSMITRASAMTLNTMGKGRYRVGSSSGTHNHKL